MERHKQNLKKKSRAGEPAAKRLKLPSLPAAQQCPRAGLTAVLCMVEVCCDPFLSVDLLPALRLLMRLQRHREGGASLTALLPLENPHTPCWLRLSPFRLLCLVRAGWRSLHAGQPCSLPPFPDHSQPLATGDLDCLAGPQRRVLLLDSGGRIYVDNPVML